MKESLSQAYEAGKSTPNGEKIEQKMSDDLVEATPPAPNMNLLVTCLLFFGCAPMSPNWCQCPIPFCQGSGNLQLIFVILSCFFL